MLKLYVRTPTDWTVVGPTAVGVNNTALNVTVRDILSNTELATSTINVSIDFGQRSDLPYSTTISLPYSGAANGYTASFREFNGSLHVLNISAGGPAGCLADSKIVYYQYRDSTIRGIPDFSPALIPAIAALSIFAMRAGISRKKRKAGN